MLLVRAMRKVQTRNVHPGAHELFEVFLAACCGADSADDFCAAHRIIPHYPFVAMICTHLRGTSVKPSSSPTWYTAMPSAEAPSANGIPGKAPSMKSQ